MSVQTVSFSAQVNDWIRKSEKRLETVFHESVQDLVEEMQKVGPSVASTRAAIREGIGSTGRGRSKKAKAGPPQAAGEGGHMPVDLGFLRASLRVTTNRPMQMDVPATGKATAYSADAAVLAILSAQIGDTLFASYTANYAARINYGFEGTDSLGRKYNQRGYQFVGLAAQKWPQFVRAAVARVQQAGI